MVWVVDIMFKDKMIISDKDYVVNVLVVVFTFAALFYSGVSLENNVNWKTRCGWRSMRF